MSETSDSNCKENKFEILNDCSVEDPNKPVLCIIDQKINVASDENDCDRPTSSSLQNFEVIDEDLKQHVSEIMMKGEILATKHSNKGCDFETNNINNKFYNVDVNFVENQNNCDYTLEIVETMDNAALLSSELSNSKELKPHSSSDLNESNDRLTNIDKSRKFCSEVDEPVSQSIDLCAKDEHENMTKCDTPVKFRYEIGKSDEFLSLDNNEDALDKPIIKQDIYCSTPNMTNKLQEKCQSADADSSDFGMISPLDLKGLRGKHNLKRKLNRLQPIEELDEDDNVSSEKKIKVVEDSSTVSNSGPPVETETSSTPYCFEVPAKSLLKKWQPSCLSRNASSTSFVVLDECVESESEECSKTNQEFEPSKVDDFEIACQSLTEELMKSSSNIETLEKYHSQVQLESQIDDEKFDEVLQELTMYYDLDHKTCVSFEAVDERTLTETDKTLLTIKPMEESETEIKEGSDVVNSISKNNTTVLEISNQLITNDNLSGVKVKIEPTKLENISEASTSSNDRAASELILKEDVPSTFDEKKTDMDEEDFLLEENISSKDKPYVFFEFVSSDPKENEDNYNPEWQKLGRLTSDEERYKAVRDRWRSLVPPDPNRNLTHRQWRVRNKKSPIKLSRLNNNHQLLDDNQKSQLCTAVFDNKINKTVQELEDSRMNIFRQRNKHFEELALAQDEENMRLRMRGANRRDLMVLHNRHLDECRTLKLQHDQELKRITDITQEKIRILREASEEVLLFQKFYKGVGTMDDNEVCMYLTDIQVQELMETEEMLDQYKQYYG